MALSTRLRRFAQSGRATGGGGGRNGHTGNPNSHPDWWSTELRQRDSESSSRQEAKAAEKTQLLSQSWNAEEREYWNGVWNVWYSQEQNLQPSLQIWTVCCKLSYLESRDAMDLFVVYLYRDWGRDSKRQRQLLFVIVSYYSLCSPSPLLLLNQLFLSLSLSDSLSLSLSPST